MWALGQKRNHYCWGAFPPGASTQTLRLWVGLLCSAPPTVPAGPARPRPHTDRPDPAGPTHQDLGSDSGRNFKAPSSTGDSK